MPITKNIPTDYLRTLIAIVDTGNYRLAGIEINRTQSAVTQQIQTLETQLGIELFERVGRTKVLTKNGVTIYTLAKQVIDANDILVSQAELMRLNGVNKEQV